MVPDYELAPSVNADTPQQLKALAEPIRGLILDLVLERAATVTELATALDRPKSSVAYHVDVLVDAPVPLAVRAVRRWLERDGYPPDAAAAARVLAVAHGDSAACELAGGLRVERRGNRLVLFPTGSATG